MNVTPNVYLFIENENKRARIVDESDYIGSGVSPSQYALKGLGVVTGPNGQAIFNGSTVGNPLVDIAVSQNGAWFNLPLDTNGNILNGTYSFTYNLRASYNSTTGSSGVFSLNAPSTIKVDFDITEVIQAGDVISITGNPVTANNGNFTIASLSYDSVGDTTDIVTTSTSIQTDNNPTTTNYSFVVLRSGFAGGAYKFNGCDFVSLKVDTFYDCDNTQFGQITFTDITDLKGQTLVSRELIGYYPPALNPSPPTPSVTTSLASLTFSELATGTWSYKLTLNMSVTQPDGLVYTYTLIESDEVKVTCVGSLCSLTPCLESFKDKLAAGYANGSNTNLIQAAITINSLIILANEYKACGEYDKYKSTYEQLEKILDSTGLCNCGCCDEDTPQWVDNSKFDAPSIFETLTQDVQSLNNQVGQLQQAVQSNANALSAFTALLGNISAFQANVSTFISAVNFIQNALNALDPNSEDFQDDVSAIEFQVLALQTNYGNLQTELGDLVNEVIAFNTSFPEYDDLTESAENFLDSAVISLALLSASITNILGVLATLTPNTYAQDIATLQSQVQSLLTNLADVNYNVNIALMSISALNDNLNFLQLQLIDVQEYLYSLPPIPTNVVNSKVKVCFATVGRNSISGPVLATIFSDFTQKGGYAKVIVKGRDTDPAAVVEIKNNATAYSIVSIPVGNNRFEIEFILMPFTNPSEGFKAGGLSQVGNTLAAIIDTTIDSPADIEYGEDLILSIESNSLTTYYLSIEVYGYYY